MDQEVETGRVKVVEQVTLGGFHTIAHEYTASISFVNAKEIGPPNVAVRRVSTGLQQLGDGRPSRRRCATIASSRSGMSGAGITPPSR
jgi:hypothetical protein